MRRLLLLVLLAAAPLAAAAQATQSPAADPLAPLDFLIGSWSSVTDTPAGSANASSAGTYAFHRDLNGHSLDRTGTSDSCKGPQGFDCSHHDRLTVFSDPNAMAVHHTSILAFYQDNEGHVIYYTVTLPDPYTVVFLSQGPASAPKFRLMYHLEGSGPKAIMSGKFQFAPPGSDDFHSYLEWSGTKQ